MKRVMFGLLMVLCVLVGSVMPAQAVVTSPLLRYDPVNVFRTAYRDCSRDVTDEAEAFAVATGGHIVFPAGCYLLNDFNPPLAKVPEFRQLAGSELRADIGHRVVAFLNAELMGAGGYDTVNNLILDSASMKTVSGFGQAKINVRSAGSQYDLLWYASVDDASAYVGVEYAKMVATNVSIPSAANRWAGETIHIAAVDTILDRIYFSAKPEYYAEFNAATTRIWAVTGDTQFNYFNDGGVISANGNVNDTSLYERYAAIEVYGAVNSVFRDVNCDGTWAMCLAIKGTGANITISGLKTQRMPSHGTDNASNTRYTVSSITQATEAVITTSSTPSQITNGDVVCIAGGAMTQVTGCYFASDLSGSTFKIKDTFGNYVNSTTYTAYTSGGHAVLSDVTAFGYGVQLYGALTHVYVNDVHAGEGRHSGFTTDGAGLSYANNKAHIMGQPTWITVNGLKCSGAVVCADMHEEGSQILLTNLDCTNPLIGPYFTSYAPFCVQVRAQKSTITHSRIEGGYYGIRYSAINHGTRPIHYVDNVDIRNLTSDNQTDTGIILQDVSALTNKMVVYGSNMKFDGVSIPIFADDDSTYIARGDTYMADFDTGVDCQAGATVSLLDVVSDFRRQTRTTGTHHGVMMRSDAGDGGCSFTFNQWDDFPGTGSDVMSALAQEQDTTATKNLNYGRFTPHADSAGTVPAIPMVNASATTIALLGNGQTEPVGVSTQQARRITAANVNSTGVGNVGTGEDNLQTYTLPANSLSKAGRGVRIVAAGTIANNANAKTLKCYAGSQLILTYAMPTSVASVWRVEATFISTGTDAQDYTSALVTFNGATALNDAELGTATQDDGASIVLKCTGEATSNNDIVQEMFMVEAM